MAWIYRTGVTALIAFLLENAHAALYTSPQQIPLGTNYDFIIIGAGAGGGVLSNRLTESPYTRVLLIEAGSSDFNNINIRVPSFASRLPNTQFDWNFTTVNQPGLNNRSIPYARGHVLGGSTSINLMAYTRGSRDDFDRWANVTGDNGWSWDSLFPLIKKMEKLTLPTDGRDITGEVNSSVHGHHGPIGTSEPNVLLSADDRVVRASNQLSDEFPFNLDFNSGDTIGIGWGQKTIADGQRVNSAIAYIAPALNRSNLDVLVNTQVTKLLKTGEEYGAPIMKGVQFTQSPAGPVLRLNATLEVIVSGGAVKTPQLLMLSGIGDAAALSKLRIPLIADIPDIGMNLQDQPLVAMSWTVNSTDTADNLTSDATFFAQQEALWMANHTGELGNTVSSHYGWIRLPDNATIFKTVLDPSAGSTSGHYELIFSNGYASFLSPFPGGHFFSVLVDVVSPSSRGNITLNSTDPFAAPVINPAMLSTGFDIFAIREAIKAIRRFMTAPAWDGYLLEEFGSFAQARTNKEIEQFARNTAVTVDHVCCTVHMGKTGTAGGGTGALNSDLTVKATRGLRVVDASAFPFIISGHTQTPTYVLAERAADLIKLAYAL